MSSKRYQTQWAGQFYVAAELTRRGYIVSFTLGNAPTTDLLARVPEGEAFSVEVKTQRTKNFWILSEPPEPDNPEDLYWVFVFLSEPHPTFFVMRSDEVSRKWHERNDKYPPGTPYCGLNWGIVKQYQDQWDALP